MMTRNLSLPWLVGLVMLAISACTTTVQTDGGGTPSDLQIDEVNGDDPIGHGQSITVTGSGFGTKTQAAPAIWDDFETGDFHPTWTGTGYPAGTLTVGPAGANARHAHSEFNTVTNFIGTDGGKWATLTGGPETRDYYAQYWFKLGDDWDWGTSADQEAPNSNLANIKIFRMWTADESVNENFVVASHGWDNRVIVKTENVSDSEGQDVADYTADGYQENWERDVWHLFQFEFRESDLDVPNGEFRWWVDGELIFETTEWITREDFSNFKRVYGLGWFNSNGDASTDDNHFFMDDAYIDNTFARVEIGNHPIYESCTHREIQIPTAWSDGSVTFTVNQGSFNSGDEVYVFVVNSGGVKSAGRLVVIE